MDTATTLSKNIFSRNRLLQPNFFVMIIFYAANNQSVQFLGTYFQ